jgi:hypothetical protein
LESEAGAAIYDQSTAHPGTHNHSEGKLRSASRTETIFRESETVRIVFYHDLLLENALEVRVDRLGVQAQGVAVFEKVGGPIDYTWGANPDERHSNSRCLFDLKNHTPDAVEDRCVAIGLQRFDTLVGKDGKTILS